MYQFQVLALNHNEEGNASLTVLGETRYGTIGQVAAMDWWNSLNKHVVN